MWLRAPRNCLAHIVAREVGPVALGFKAEHPGASLPAVADLATDRAAGRVMGALGPTKKGATESQELRLEPQPPFAPI